MIALFIFVLGLSAGSFVNALVWRLYEQSKHKKVVKELSITKGRSMCPQCRHTLSWYDLLPVVSWTILRGRCRYCKKKISWQYPIVELAAGLLFVWSYVAWVRPTSLLTWAILALWLVILTGLLALFIYDLRWMLLPNRIVFPLYVPGVLYGVLSVIAAKHHLTVFIQIVLASLLLGGLFWLLFQISAGRWIGGGDVKLGFLLGLLAGSVGCSLFLLFIASLLGTIVAIPLLMRHKASANTRLAFGPFLIVATFLTVLYGTQILNWYQRLIIKGA